MRKYQRRACAFTCLRCARVVADAHERLAAPLQNKTTSLQAGAMVSEERTGFENSTCNQGRWATASTAAKTTSRTNRYLSICFLIS